MPNEDEAKRAHEIFMEIFPDAYERMKKACIPYKDFKSLMESASLNENEEKEQKEESCPCAFKVKHERL